MKPQPLLLRQGHRAAILLIPIGDQIVYSASNILVFLFAARGGLNSAGAATLLQTGYVLSCTVIQGAGIEATILQPALRGREATRMISGIAMQIGIAWAFATLILAHAFHMPKLAMLSALAAPLIAIQYAMRSWALAHRNYRGPLVSDSVWLMSQCLTYFALAEAGLNLLSASLLAWAFGGMIACLTLGFPRTRWPRPAESFKQLLDNMSYAWELLVGQGMAQVAALVVGAVAGPATVGLYKSAQIIFTPVNLVSSPLRQIYLPRMIDVSARQQVRQAILVTSILSMISISCFIVFDSAPASLGSLLMGESWAQVHGVLVWLLAESAAGTLIFAPAILFRARRQISAGIAIRGVSAAVIAGFAIFAACLSRDPMHYARIAPWGTVVAAGLWYLCFAIVSTRARSRRNIMNDRC